MGIIGQFPYKRNPNPNGARKHMTILHNITDVKRQKIYDAMKELGRPSDKPQITSANRNAVRSWLNGMGFPTACYESASLDKLAAAYHSFTYAGQGLGLIPFVIHEKHYPLDVIARTVTEAIEIPP